LSLKFLISHTQYILLTYADDLLRLRLHPVGSPFVSHSEVFIWVTLMHLITGPLPWN